MIRTLAPGFIATLSNPAWLIAAAKRRAGIHLWFDRLMLVEDFERVKTGFEGYTAHLKSGERRTVGRPAVNGIT